MPDLRKTVENFKFYEISTKYIKCLSPFKPKFKITYEMKSVQRYRTDDAMRIHKKSDPYAIGTVVGFFLFGAGNRT